MSYPGNSPLNAGFPLGLFVCSGFFGFRDHAVFKSGDFDLAAFFQEVFAFDDPDGIAPTGASGRPSMTSFANATPVQTGVLGFCRRSRVVVALLFVST